MNRIVSSVFLLAAFLAAVPAPAGAAEGWSIKPRGRLQVDAGWIGRLDGVAAPGLGSGSELRRARFGVEGMIPGGFSYLFEVDLAEGEIEVTDAILAFRPSAGPAITVGQHNNFQSLDELTSSRVTSFIERAAFTDAFDFERRLGVSATYAAGAWIAQAGVFADNVHDLADDADDGAGVDGRLVFAPRLGGAQLHLAASAHLRDGAVAIRYRQRPLAHFTETRFIAAPVLPVERETSFGLEAALIQGRFHAAAEAHWLHAATATPGPSPTFFGFYAEIGWFLTGETRGYRGGRFDRTPVRRPLGGEGGGFGALQLNLRYDHLDLASGGVAGGVQNGLIAGLVWIPADHFRLLFNYARLGYRGAAIPAAGGRRDYGVDVVAARAQLDF